MLEGVREFLNTTPGKVVAVCLILVALGIGAFTIRGTFGQSDIAGHSSGRMFVDSVTGKPFAHTISIGDKIPVSAPSGGNTGYPGEPCYWTKDGKAKSEPTWVLLNDYLGKTGPTYCPDCGRLVVVNNPAPGLGIEVPPTASDSSVRKSESK